MRMRNPAGEYIQAGDMLEAEQNKAMALKRSVADAERRVSELSSTNSGLAKQLEAAKCAWAGHCGSQRHACCRSGHAQAGVNGRREPCMLTAPSPSPHQV